MHFSELRLSGFKSFVEPTTLKIEHGMTGIVGPNGCGKSNLIEALRWVMGETSAKKMRGSEMDDVIFGGTEARPAWNVANVTLGLDNSKRDATAEYNHNDEIEISRTIERGEGSDYRVNGKAVRQKDVQLIFADQATGAHATNIVSQGQVGAIVNAKPQERRQILEEAAGITGLHARRHEAELRLRAAETNLTRADDLLRGIEGQYNSLQRQAKQAAKYRETSEIIRQTEATLLHVKWSDAQTTLTDSDTALTQSDRQVRDLTVIVTRGNTTRAELAATLPPLREEEAAAAAVLQRLIIQRETLDTEITRAAAQLEEQRRLLEQTLSDATREQSLTADAEAAIARLSDEAETLTELQVSLTQQLPQYEAEATAATSKTDAAEARVTTALNTLSRAEAERMTISSEIEKIEARLNYLAERRSTAESKLRELNDADTGAGRRDAAAVALGTAETLIDTRQKEADNAEAAWNEAESNLAAARSAKLAEQASLTKAEAEAAALIEILSGGEALFEPVINQISTDAGCEAALAAALGDALTAGLASDAPIYWRDTSSASSAPALPNGCEPIANYIKVPAALQRAISYIGLVADATIGQRLASQLQPGQTLVSRAGDCWRWDGFTVKADAPTPAAVKLKQKNRLAEVKKDIAAQQQAVGGASNLFERAEANVERTLSESRAARAALQEAYKALDAARSANASIATEEAAAQSEREAVRATLATLNEEHSELQTNLENARSRQDSLQDVTPLQTALDAERKAHATARNAEANAQRILLEQKTELTNHARRAETVASDIQSWQSRMATAAERQESLANRRTQAEATIARLQAQPEVIEAQRKGMMGDLSSAETKRKAATDKLVAAETQLNECERQLKKDEEQMVVARENRVRAEGSVAAAQHLMGELQARMVEKLDATPEQLPELGGFEPTDDLPTAASLDEKLTRYVRERDAMGPVNLRADVEAEALIGDLSRVKTERDDLTSAISKLRQGIHELNTEARTRLNEAFDKVNENFQELFVRLFGGGRAYLQLQEADDPLEAGLEIYASPPGKKLQVLSLLSGGEKALTATALLFAVFICNPSPICVLDEVDAPLDESNVGRFCDMVEEISRNQKTRFLIVTHHRLTMARMDRLYGVTMQERGISSLMSVDLATAERFRETGNENTAAKAA